MRLTRRIGRKGERGVVILLVAVVLLFVVGAMAVLAIDVVTSYTARSEAQLAANAAALAGARTLANSGMTSLPADALLTSAARTLAIQTAKQIAANNQVAGRVFNPASEVVVTFPNQGSATFGSNPHVEVQVSRNDLPAFFSRIFGRTQNAVSATATAEAYNPSGLVGAANSGQAIAPLGVKPWLLPNLDPTTGSTIFNPANGAITNPALVGTTVTGPGLFDARCNPCTSPFPAPTQWTYYPGDPADFPPPTQLPSCNVALNTPYKQSIAGVVTTPIACNQQVNIDTGAYPTRQLDTAQAVNCMSHTLADKGDRVLDNPGLNPGLPFRFVGGDDNPVAAAVAQDILVSDSLVTVPVFDSPNPVVPFNNPVTIIGFVQVFLNPDGVKAPLVGPPFQIKTTIVNLAGCGAAAGGQPIIGNGASAIPVRLIANP
ncbi:MAG TPA: pilus assembly protein TadG-related protein [Terriglobales bacterium]|nr:pilus assembly protein TadG-related protein [Terriglobales bacterium]